VATRTAAQAGEGAATAAVTIKTATPAVTAAAVAEVDMDIWSADGSVARVASSVVVAVEPRTLMVAAAQEAVLAAILAAVAALPA
jgi:hypothetical protein